MQHGSRCAMWVPPENTDPVVLHAPTRKSVGFLGAVRVSDGLLITLKANKFNANSFVGLLSELWRRRRPGKKIVVVVDNARWHHSSVVRDWVKAKRKTLKLVYLPPYSPDLNSIERVWKLTRRLCTHNRYFDVLEELIEVIESQFRAWRKPNKALYKLCAII